MKEKVPMVEGVLKVEEMSRVVLELMLDKV